MLSLNVGTSQGGQLLSKFFTTANSQLTTFMAKATSFFTKYVVSFLPSFISFYYLNLQFIQKNYLLHLSYYSYFLLVCCFSIFLPSSLFICFVPLFFYFCVFLVPILFFSSSIDIYHNVEVISITLKLIHIDMLLLLFLQIHCPCVRYTCSRPAFGSEVMSR